jgi:microcystin degradation protein MlrC
MTTAETSQTVWVQAPIMWPPTGTATADEPMRTLETMAREMEAADPAIAAVSVFAGFSFADTPDTGVSFTATTFGDPESARKKLDELSAWAIEHQELGNRVDESLSDAMASIQDDINGGRTPVVIVEPADNIGGGAPGDATTILRTLIEHRIDNSAVVINDPRAVAEIDQGSLSPGSITRLTIGGGSQLTDGPLELDVEILARSDGKFELEDHHSHLASMNGIHIDMGACAVVRHQGVTILLTSRKTPPFDLAQLRSQGIVPEKLNVIGVKAAVAHRRAYDTISKSSYTVDTPGPCSSNLSGFPFKKVRRPIYPLDE